ncbi:hypothetical protein FSP39_013589 [Pinctada imbricata]|uniref:Tripartite motif-containing protein 2 n=1 Tax=Pinctada imbricata TaxID=66713 RepID=A0AA89BJB9_PINIB|nr:hypothetical protein FSP39_013589 [Pinctada imbricata]
MSEYKDAVAKNSLPALRNISKGKLSLPEIGSKLELPDPPKFVDGYLQSIVENLRKLIISPSSLMSKQLKITTPTVVSKLKCPLDGYSRICITKEGDVWLGGHKSRKLVMVDIKGQVIRRMKMKNRTAALAVMDSGDVILSPHGDDSKSVSKLMKYGREQRVFDSSPSASFGVSVTSDQKILICTVDGRVVRINDNGTNAKEIYKGSRNYSTIHAVENANGNTYISNRTNHAVVIVSRDGLVLSTITQTRDGRKLQKPKGLVMDKMHNILCADTDADCVYIIDQNQEMRELVGPSHGIESPQWLAVDNNENLWIAQENGNVHVVKYLSA